MGPITGTTVETDYKKFGPLLQADDHQADGDGPAAGRSRSRRSSTTRSIRTTFEPPAPIKALVK